MYYAPSVVLAAGSPKTNVNDFNVLPYLRELKSLISCIKIHGTEGETRREFKRLWNS